MTAHRLGLPGVPGLLLRRIRSRWGADLPLWSRRPPGLVLLHNAMGVVIHPDSQIAGPAVVMQQVTLGNAWTGGAGEGAPTLDPFVFVGSGARILGNIRVGAYSVIGANSVVTRDVPAQTLVTVNGRRDILRDDVIRNNFSLFTSANSKLTGWPGTPSL